MRVNRAPRASRCTPPPAPHIRNVHHLARRPAHAFPPTRRQVRFSGSSSVQQQVVQTFSTPLSHFVFTIGQIARMITYAGLSIGALVAVSWEGGHQYIEHFLMDEYPPGLISAARAAKDTWGWEDEQAEESWGSGSSSGGGTDSRLGIKGRHALRSAWHVAVIGAGAAVRLHWGQAGGGGPSGLNVRGRKMTEDDEVDNPTMGLPAEADGLAMAEKYLLVVMSIAEKKGIKLPDIAALSSGIITPHQAGVDAPLDPTAVALETRLAGVRERLGSPDHMKLAVEGYERIYDALTATQATNQMVAGKDTGQPYVPTTRLVRLARKLGDLNVSLGKRDEAEMWLLKSVELAGGRSDHQQQSRDDVLKQIKGVALEQGELLDVNQHKQSTGWFSTWFAPSTNVTTSSTASTTPAAKASTDHVTTAQTPTPGLTRSLISTLISMSALYASPPTASTSSAVPLTPSDPAWRKGLEEALLVQASALRLIRFELERTANEQSQSSSPSSSSMPQSGSELHTLWLRHKESMISVHLAETMYALQQSSASKSKFKNLFSSSSSKDKHIESINWLKEAQQAAKQVQDTLLSKKQKSTPENKKKQDAKATAPVLSERWTTDPAIKTPASRLARDAMRVSKEADGMLSALSR